LTPALHRGGGWPITLPRPAPVLALRIRLDGNQLPRGRSFSASVGPPGCCTGCHRVPVPTSQKPHASRPGLRCYFKSTVAAPPPTCPSPAGSAVCTRTHVFTMSLLRRPRLGEHSHRAEPIPRRLLHQDEGQHCCNRDHDRVGGEHGRSNDPSVVGETGYREQPQGQSLDQSVRHVQRVFER